MQRLLAQRTTVITFVPVLRSALQSSTLHAIPQIPVHGTGIRATPRCSAARLQRRGLKAASQAPTQVLCDPRCLGRPGGNHGATQHVNRNWHGLRGAWRCSTRCALPVRAINMLAPSIHHTATTTPTPEKTLSTKPAGSMGRIRPTSVNRQQCYHRQWIHRCQHILFAVLLLFINHVR